MSNPIEVVPAIKRLELIRVGCWEELSLNFLPSLNLITETDATLGKTTILRAILQFVFPSSQYEHPLTPTFGSEEGNITIEFMASRVNISIPIFRGMREQPTANESVGHFMLSQLRSCLKTTPKGMALLINDEVTACLDNHDYREAVDLLNGAQCQVICLIAHRLNLHDYPNARVYACSIGDGSRVRMRLQQSGRVDEK